MFEPIPIEIWKAVPMKLRLDYGRSGLTVEIPDPNLMKVLQMQPAEPLADPEKAVEESLQRPIGGASLSELARGKHSACVAICDITRPAPNRILLPPILRTLEEAGMPRGAITILIATGLHRSNEGDELHELIGEEVAQVYRVVNHVGRDMASHSYLGTTESGTPAHVDRRFVEAELRIVVGFIEPHLMAGYSGGRKLVCPGLAGVETTKVFHSPRLMVHEKAREGVLDGNPVHREALAVAKMAGVHFAVDVALDRERRMLGVFSGELEASHMAGVEFVRRHVRDTIREPADIVVTTGGGYPLDATFYQAIKGMTAAVPAVKQGGTLIVAAECSEGLGSAEFVRLLRDYPDPWAFDKAVCEDGFFVIDQWQYQMLLRALGKAEILLVNESMPPEQRSLVPLPVFERFEAALDIALKRHGPEATIAAIPQGPYVLAELAL